MTAVRRTQSASPYAATQAIRLNILSTYPKGQQWTMAGRWNKKREASKANKAPAPGTYTLPTTLRTRQISFGGSRTKTDPKPKQAPDCTTYDPIDPNHKTPSFSILGRMQTRPKSAMAMCPGPGAYNPKRQRKIRTATITGRTPPSKTAARLAAMGPGPGEYQIDQCYKFAFRAASTAKIHAPTKIQRPKSAHARMSIPGPGTYMLPTTLKQRNISFGTSRANLADRHGKLVLELGDPYTSF
eukprot:gene598-1017_t